VAIVANHLGYKDTNNGAALSMLATLGYYGLTERPKDGYLNVSKDVETYKHTPSESTKTEIARRWLKTPQIFLELLEKYSAGLPSDATIKFDLIERGFKPQSADICLSAFRRSVDFAKFFENIIEPDILLENDDSEGIQPQPFGTTAQAPVSQALQHSHHSPTSNAILMDRIPVRLPGGRRAWIEVPTPFFTADKERLKAQIELLLVDDEERATDE
jgi:hypothetical protein